MPTELPLEGWGASHQADRSGRRTGGGSTLCVHSVGEIASCPV